ISLARITCSRYSASAAVGRLFGFNDTQARPSSTILAGLVRENSTCPIPIATCCRIAASGSFLPFASRTWSLACAYGSVCKSSSDSTTPKENKSAFTSYRSPSITSGAIHNEVPTPAVIVWSSRSLEIPKSVSLASIARFSRMFRDLRSRWMTGGISECRYVNA
ncbi:hypothetical protein JG688_00002693, partial [Phytophthora aleatoria]